MLGIFSTSVPLPNFLEKPLLYLLQQLCGHFSKNSVSNLFMRNHLVQNLRAYFVLYVIAILFKMYVQENFKLSEAEPIHNFMRYLLCYNDITTIRKVHNNSQGWQKACILLPRVGICHPMPPHDYGPVLKILPCHCMRNRDMWVTPLQDIQRNLI